MKQESLSAGTSRSAPAARREWAEAWQRSWDRLEERYVPYREELLGTLVDVVEAVVGVTPRVLDLASGTGTVTRRMLKRLPGARSTTVDVDPVLLCIASATFCDDDRVHVLRADLRDPSWAAVLPDQPFDAAVTATALHWLPEETVSRLYHDLATLVAPGGVLVHAEQMPLVDQPSLAAALADFDERQRLAEGQANDPDWNRWWEEAARDPGLETAALERRRAFSTNYPQEEFSPPAEWHVATLIGAGFSEAGVVWRSRAAAVLAAVR